MKKTQLIIALDVDSQTKALKLVKMLYPKVKIFKIGLQLFTKEGPGIVKAVQKTGAQVFLDLKFCDIPNTVKNAVIEASKLGVFMLTLHSCGGEEMLKAAAAARGRVNLLGVTVLTSKKYPGFEKDALQYAQAAKKSGLQGIVCSVAMAKLLKKRIKGMFFVCPGIRLENESCGDQKQTATPREAKETGVDYIVVGRPIVKAPDPKKAADGVLKEVN